MMSRDAELHCLYSGSQFYLSSNILSSCADVYLVSNDGFYFQINAGVLASVSSLPTEIFQKSEEFLILTTEVGKQNLAKILRFCVSGVLENPHDLTDQDVLKSFLSFGIQLQGLNWSQEVPEAEDERIFCPEAMPCEVVKRKLYNRPAPKRVCMQFNLGSLTK